MCVCVCVCVLFACLYACHVKVRVMCVVVCCCQYLTMPTGAAAAPPALQVLGAYLYVCIY